MMIAGMNRLRAADVEMDPSIARYLITSIVAGTLGALVANAAGAPVALVSVLGAAAGLGYLVGLLEIGRRSVGSGPPDVRFPTPGDVSAQG